MAHFTRTLVFKSKDLSLMLGPHKVEGENGLLKGVFGPVHKYNNRHE